MKQLSHKNLMSIFQQVKSTTNHQSASCFKVKKPSHIKTENIAFFLTKLDQNKYSNL